MATTAPITLEGNLVEDPQLQESNGTKFVRFTVAVNPRIRDGQGGYTDGEPEFHRVTAFGALGENTAAQLKKGDRAVVSGDLTFKTFHDKETGKTRQNTEIVASNIGASTRFADSVLVNRGPRREPSTPAPTGPVATPSQEPWIAGPRV